MCNRLSPIWVMLTNIHDTLCKQCDAMKYDKDIQYLCVPFHEKDKAKLWGALWDKDIKKWYVYKHNTNIDTVL